MKKISGRILAALGAFALGITALSSCENVDYPDRFRQTDGTPVVYFVRYADKDVAITQASMEELVCLVGDNLTSIHNLYFNDQEAILNTSYMTDHTLVVAVPKNMPKEQTDKIYMVNKAGVQTTYDFKVLPPAPKITGMSLEWAKPGDRVTIYGNYLFEPVTVEFPGATIDPTDVTYISSEAIEVTVPAGAQPGKVKVTSDSGTAQSVFQYKDDRGMLFDFDGITGLDNHGWNGHSFTTDDTALSGNFIQFGNGTATLDEKTWDESNFSFVYWPGSWNDPENYEGAPRLIDIVDFSNWSNMALKFEMYIPSSSPWTNCSLQLCFAGTDVVSYGGAVTDIYGNAVAGANNAYMTSNTVPRALYNPWKGAGSYDTGDKWITVTLPLADEFVYGWDAKVCGMPLTAESFSSLWVFLCQGNVEEGVVNTPIIKIDNIRAVPYK